MNADIRAGWGIGLFERADVERIGDAELGGAAAAGRNLGRMAHEVAAVRDPYVPVMLPQDQAEESERMAAEEEEGINSSDYVCILCEFGADGNSLGACSDVMRKINEYIRDNERRIPDHKLNAKVADIFNKQIYNKWKIYSTEEGTKLKPLTGTAVKHHRTVCNRGDPIGNLWNMVDQMDKVMTFILYNGLYKVRKSQITDPTAIEMDDKACDRWLKVGKCKGDLLISIHKLDNGIPVSTKTIGRSLVTGIGGGTGGGDKKRKREGGAFTDI
jgi:hypothetical protein